MDLKSGLNSILWIFILPNIYDARDEDHEGIDIGYSCKYDAECKKGNGGMFSKCNQALNICICTINHLGEDKCMPDSYKYEGFCRPRSLYSKPGFCTLECSPKGTMKWTNRDWYGIILDPFSTYIHDKKTSVCFDPRRAFNSVPDGFEIKPSTISKAGLGAFTKTYIPQDTILGPYKGIFEPDTDEAILAGYSWKINPREGEGRADVVWVDAKDVTLSNWLRYGNTPINAEMENLVAFQFKGEMFYQAYRPIQPGSELFIWYGDSYGEFLEIEPFDPPRYYYANFGYVGGACHEEDEGLPCVNDDNTICADKSCFCVSGTHVRAGKCFKDGTLGGLCTELNGETCKLDANAECQKGVCVCKKDSIPSNGICTAEEMFGGRCRGKDGKTCMRDDNAECVHGLCRCKYGTTAIGKTCLKDESYQGRCIGDDGDACENDQHAECLDKICVCKKGASAVNGSCVLDEKYGGRCWNGDGTPCRLDQNANCISGVCTCKSNTRLMNGICRTDGALEGMCVKGNCNGKNVDCDSMSNTCKCKVTHFPYAGKCVKK